MADPVTDSAGGSSPMEPATGLMNTAAPAAIPQGPLDQVVALIQAGGPVVMILIGFSVVALAIIFVKLWQFGRSHVGDRKTARRALRLFRDGRTADALALASKTRNPAAQVLALAINGQRRGLPETIVREEAFRFGGDMLELLRTGFRPLEVIASLAPLLGLFGTVLGMIDAFQRLEAAGNQLNPAILSGGIWEALLTTAVGLAVAIPVIIVHNWLDRTVESLTHEMDSVVTQVFTVDLRHTAPDETSHERTAYRPAAAAAGD